MLAKIIVTGRTRKEALERSRRALAETVIEGMPTVLPFHQVVVEDPAFAPEFTDSPDDAFSVHTRWIETEFDNQIAPFDGSPEAAAEQAARQNVVVEVGGKRLEVSLPGDLAVAPAGGKGKSAGRRTSRKSGGGSAASGDSLTAPMQGTVVKVSVEDGATVSAGDTIVVVEAMKMEQPITAHKDGVVTGLKTAVGETVTAGSVIAEIKDAE